MGTKEKNSIIILLYLYMRPLLNLVSPILNAKQVSNIGYIITIFLIIYVLFINNFHIPKKFMGILMFFLMYMSINLLLVPYKYFVLVEVFTVLMNCFLPLYVILLRKIKCEDLLKYWFELAKVLTLIFPIYILLYSKSFIRYADIGNYSHMNTLIMVYFLFILRDIRFSTILFLIINVSMGLIIGSRMLFASSILTSIGMVLFISKEKGYRYYLRIIFFSILAVVVGINIKSLLYFTQSIMLKHGLKSRNLTLFIAQVEGGSLESIGAGRDKIYEVVLKYIKNRSGLPGGLAVTRYITDGKFYFSHNVFLDFILLLGTKGSIFFIIWFIYRNYKLFKVREENYHRFALYFMLMVSFLIRSITGAYFVKDKFFLVAVSLLISSTKQKSY